MSYYGYTGLIKGIDYTAGNNGIDRSTASLQTVTYEHHEIHQGSHYFVSRVVDLAINNVFDIQFICPNVTKWNHLTFEVNSESETIMSIYEGVTLNVNGTVIPAVNNNRNSANVSQNTIYGITNGSLVLAEADTDTSAATSLERIVVGAGRDSGTSGRGNEIILKQNTIYCFRMEATVAGFVDYRLNWYEHTDKF